ncbi:MAG: pilus assembly protein TadG-related protein [Phenylobacterium sp.]|uniref:pilus assembly protein TadG-related protein n=1 Tax=Phenylobacterium sp. TaxID=1871053 RepID=UPI003919AA79
MRLPLIQHFRADRRGNVAVLFALALPLVIAGAGFGVETSYWYIKRNGLQAAADAAAHAAAIEKRSGGDVAVIEQVAGLTAEQNGFDAAGGAIEVAPENLPNGGRVAVTLRENAPRFFTAFFVEGEVTFAARAVATYNSASSACILALHPTIGEAAKFSGSSVTTLTGCSVMANSIATNAVNVQGSSKLTTDCAISGGGVTATSGLTLTQCDTPVTQAPPVADPYKDLPAPPVTGSCKSVPNGQGAKTLQPGRYCSGMDLKGDVTLQPGVYVLEGDFAVNSTASVIGDGVMIYLAGAGRVKINGTPHIELSAPTSGTYSGMLFFGDRNSSGGDNKFLGDATSKFTGSIYFANQHVAFQGNVVGDNGCTQVVGRTVEWTGNGTVSADCSAYGMSEIPVLNLVRLTA